MSTETDRENREHLESEKKESKNFLAIQSKKLLDALDAGKSDVTDEVEQVVDALSKLTDVFSKIAKEGGRELFLGSSDGVIRAVRTESGIGRFISLEESCIRNLQERGDVENGERLHNAWDRACKSASGRQAEWETNNDR